MAVVWRNDEVSHSHRLHQRNQDLYKKKISFNSKYREINTKYKRRRKFIYTVGSTFMYSRCLNSVTVQFVANTHSQKQTAKIAKTRETHFFKIYLPPIIADK